MTKRLLALLLAVMVVASCLTIGAAAVTTNEVVTKLDNIMTQSEYEPGYTGGRWGQNDCWVFVNAVSQQLFNEGAPTGTSGYLLTNIANHPNWSLVGTRTASNDSVLELLKQAIPGDILQFKSTAATWQHTSMVYNVTESTISIYEFRNPESGVTLRTFNFNTLTNNPNLFSSSGVGSFTSSSYGLSIYRHNSVDSGTPVDPPTKPDAPDASVVRINYKTEQILFDGRYEVSDSTSFSSTITSGEKATPGSVLYVRVRANEDENRLASDSTQFTLPSRPIINDVTFDYANEVYNSTSSMEYSFDSSAWTVCTGTLPLSAVSGRDIVYFRIAATDSSYASKFVSATVPTRGVAPTGLGKTDETVDQRDDGTITGVTSAMEYRVSGGSWADCPDGTITGLADGTYEIRYKATSGALASESASVVIAQGVPQTFTLEIAAPEFDDVIYNYTQPDSKPLVITSSGNTDSTITGVTADSESFIIGTGSKTVPYGQSISDWTIQPVAGLAAGTYTATVTVTYNGGATASDTVSFAVEKAPQAAPGAPEIAKRGYTSIELKALPANENGAVAQYRIDGGEWQFSPVFEKLSPGRSYTFEQRYAPVGSYLASPASAAVKFQTLFNIPDTYPITIEDTANGEVDTSLSNASRGSVITVTVDPDEGYSLGSLTVTGPDGRLDVTRVNATTYRFTMPEGEVTVRATFTRGGLPFTDVAVNAWYYDAVSYAYTNGLMDGVSATAFNPDGNMTRAMVWAILARLDGETVTGSDWVSEARAWAMAEEVSDGTEPNAFVTREQLVTMLWRYAGEPAVSGGLSSWRDAASVSDWASDAMVWALDEGIITGVTAVTLDPQGTATRAQCAAILMRYAENV